MVDLIDILARRDLSAHIEGYYIRQHIHSALGYLTPEQAERTTSSSPRVRESREGSAIRIDGDFATKPGRVSV